MAKYKKKPVVIEAEVYSFGMEDGIKKWNFYIPADAEKYPEESRSKKYSRYHLYYDNILDEFTQDSETEWRAYIETLEGQIIISKGDYIITGIKGERYSCKPDVFEQTYELVEE